MSEGMWQAAIDLVISVGERVLSWRGLPSAKKIHSIQDMKTEADRKAHELLREGLSALSLDFPIISEEDPFHDDCRSDAYWIIDPIDGTASWYEGYPGFVCQAAFIENDVPIFGVLHAPVLEKTWYALLGHGAWLNGKQLPAIVQSNNRLVLVDNYPKPKRASLVVTKSLSVDEYVESGSIGLKCALVADGTADLFVKDVVVRDWDIAPAWVLLYEVGAHICLPDGGIYKFSGSYEKELGILVARDCALACRVVSVLQGRDDAKGVYALE